MEVGKHESRIEVSNYSRGAHDADSDGGDRKRRRRCEESPTKRKSSGENDDVAVDSVNEVSDIDPLVVDHSQMEYLPFRKNFYVEVKDISLTPYEEVEAFRKGNHHEIRGNGVPLPRPLKAWDQTGLATELLDALKYDKPTPLQAQALPAIMSGRDFIGIAKTGSGKTLAFVLPMLRHVKDQPPAVSGDGPIALVMAPTRELVEQIHRDISGFAPAVGVICVPVYGVAQQTSELKRGAEIAVCTPGTMVDVLGAKITNLNRVTYLVMDEADRMFNMGFEPQITRIVQNIQPGRQTLVFSATLPCRLDNWAKKVLITPVELRVVGRSVVSKEIAQMVEVLPHSERLSRLLELLGESYGKGQILVFVKSCGECDHLARRVLGHGYPCLSLHGLIDETDRESTIADFKTNACKLLFTMGHIARRLEAEDLELVINYDVPTFYEEYVRRVGRTRKGNRAFTFISEEDSRYAPDLVKALELSEQVVPDDLKALAEGALRGAMRIPRYEGRKLDSNKEIVRKVDSGKAEIVRKVFSGKAAAEAELEINDFPQYARWMVTHKEFLGPLSDSTGAAITTMGQFSQLGWAMDPTERKLYLLIQGPTEHSVERAKAELKRALEEFTDRAPPIPTRKMSLF